MEQKVLAINWESWLSAKGPGKSDVGASHESDNTSTREYQPVFVTRFITQSRAFKASLIMIIPLIYFIEAARRFGAKSLRQR